MIFGKIFVNFIGLIQIDKRKIMSYTKPKFKEKYGNFINGKFADPVGGEYFENRSPIDNSLIAKYARSGKEDVQNAVDAANAAKEAWGNTPAATRASLLK